MKIYKKNNYYIICSNFLPSHPYGFYLLTIIVEKNLNHRNFNLQIDENDNKFSINAVFGWRILASHSHEYRV